MPPQPPPETSEYEMSTSEYESLSTCLQDFGVFDEDFSSAPRVPRYGTEMPHDGEASGSGSHAQPAFGSEFAASIFATPPPVPPVSTGDASWDTAEQILRSADAPDEPERDGAWPRWPRRANAGVPPHRYSPSPF